jgi:fibronectin type 3 domain-containing protein
MYISQDVADQLKTIARICEQSIYECYDAEDDPNKGYPYAAGYSRSALKNILENVNYLLKSHESN